MFAIVEDSQANVTGFLATDGTTVELPQAQRCKRAELSTKADQVQQAVKDAIALPKRGELSGIVTEITVDPKP